LTQTVIIGGGPAGMAAAIAATVAAGPARITGGGAAW